MGMCITCENQYPEELYFCDRCGAVNPEKRYTTGSKSQNEVNMVNEFHALLLNALEKNKVMLIKFGYLPVSSTALLLCGKFCIEQISAQDNNPFRDALVSRLKSVSARLRYFEADSTVSEFLSLAAHSTSPANKNQLRQFFGLHAREKSLN